MPSDRESTMEMMRKQIETDMPVSGDSFCRSSSPRHPAAAAYAESDDGAYKKTGEALDVSAARVKTPEAALPVAFNLARLVEDRGMVADAERRYRDLLVASPKMKSSSRRSGSTAFLRSIRSTAP